MSEIETRQRIKPLRFQTDRRAARQESENDRFEQEQNPPAGTMPRKG